MSNRTLAALSLTFAAIGLSACTAEAGPTVSGEKLAEAAADALEGQIGSRPEIDCGDDSIIVSQDKEVDCVLTDSASGSEYDTTVTFTGVDGDKWNIDVQVADEPKGGGDGAAPDEATDDEAAEEPAETGDGLEIAGDRLADAAADALEGQIGSRPEIDCGDLALTVYEGRQVFCQLTDPETGSEYETTITITTINGEEFDFDVSVADTPN